MRRLALLVGGLLLVSLVFAPTAQTTPSKVRANGTSNWPMFHSSPDHMGVNAVDNVIGTGNVDQLTVSWKVKTGGKIWSGAAVADGKVFVGSDDFKVYAFDAGTGTVKWTAKTNGRVRSSPAYDNGVVFVGSADRYLYAIDASTGAIKWKAGVDGSILFAPTVMGGTVYMASKKPGTLYAIDEATGAVKWTAHPNYGNTWSSPAVVDSTVYMGWDDSKLYALDASTGATKWSAVLGGMVRSAPTVAGGVVYVGADDGLLYAVNATTGAISWSAPTAPSFTTPFVRSSPAVVGGLVYVTSAENTPMAGHLYAFSSATGSLIWTGLLNDYSESSPAVANGIVYVGAEKQLYAFDAVTGTKLWTSGESVMGGNVQKSDPAVAQGQVFQGSKDQYLYAFGIISGQVVGAVVDVDDAGFNPRLVTAFDPGKQAQFDFVGASTHSVVDSSGMGLIDSGPLGPGATYLVGLPGAGNYDYKDGYSSATGTIKVPLDITPRSGSVSTTFTVTWAAGPPPAGFVYDVQIQRPGGSYYLDWMMGQMVPSATYLPTSGPGTYSFHARLTNALTGKHNQFSTPFSITVT
jgi:outer membrane protein assembly factor BamB